MGLWLRVRTGLVLAFGLGLSACATPSGFLGSETEPQSVYGSYLAARYASSSRDLQASSALYEDALMQAPGSGLISQRAFFAALLAGDFDRADRVVQLASRDESTAQIATLYRKAVNLGRRRAADDDGAQSADVYGPFTSLVDDILNDWDAYARGRPTSVDSEQIHLRTPQNSSPHRMLHQAMLLEAIGHVDEAETAYRQALTGVAGLEAFAALQAGAYLERRGRSQEALSLYRSFFNDGGRTDARLEAAIERVEAGGRPPRLGSARQSAARALYMPAALITRGPSVEYAVLYLRLVQRLDPDFHGNTQSIAQMLESMELIDLAIRAYDEIDDGPLAERARLRALWLRFVERPSQRDGLINEVRQLYSQAPSTASQLLLADMLRASDQCAEATGLYTDVIVSHEADGQSAPWQYVFYAAVCTEIELGWEAARPVFERTLELAPDEPLVLNHLGYNLIIRGDELERGLQMVERAVELDPSNGAIVDSLGWGHFKVGNNDQAIYWLERAVFLSPGSATNNWHLGDAYARAGRDLEARFQWRRALELSDDHQDGEGALIERRLELGLDAGPADLP